MKRLLILFALLLSLAPARLAAQSEPPLIPFQGRLTDQTGQPVTNGVFSVVFQFYTAPVGGDILWSERHERVGVINGMVNVFLGSIAPLTNIDFSTTRHLGITVDIDQNPNTPDVEMVPRQMIIPAVWARNSDKLAGQDWTPLFGVNSPLGTIAGTKITPGTIGGAQLAASAVQSQHLAVGSVTSDKLSSEVAGGLGGGGGRSAGGINYVAGGGGDSVSGWILYKDAPGASPVTATGSITNIGITWTRGTNGYLRQGNEFLLTVNGGISRQGEGVGTDFTIDPADQARSLTISYDAMVVAGGFRQGDLRLYLVAAPGTTNTTVIEPVATEVPAAAQGLPFQGRATFQTLNKITRYRLCIHVASSSTSGYLLAFDNVTVGPQATQTGTAISDWREYPVVISADTPPNFGSAGSIKGRWRRIGDSAHIMVTASADGSGISSGSGEYKFSLPAGLVIDLDKLAAARLLSFTALGSMYLIDNSKQQYVGTVVPVSSTQLQCSIHGIGIVQAALPSANWLNGVGDTISLECVVPILGWSSSFQMGSDAGDGRVVAFSYTGGAEYNFSAGAALYFPNKEFDTHAAYSVGTPAEGSSYRVPVAGYYLFKLGFDKTGDVIGHNFALKRGGKRVGELGFQLDAGQSFWIVPCSSGDVMTVSCQSTSGRTYYEYNNFSGFLISSGGGGAPSSETVAAKYFTSTNGVAGASAPFNFDTKVFDTHGAVTVGPGWRFTAPVGGKYLVSGFFNPSANPLRWVSMLVAKNGMVSDVLCAASEPHSSVGGSCLVELRAGDWFDIRTDLEYRWASGPIRGSRIDILRVGN